MTAELLLTSQQRFKLDHARRVRGAAVAACALLALIWWFAPAPAPAPYRLRATELTAIDIVVVEPPAADKSPLPVYVPGPFDQQGPVDIEAAPEGVAPAEVPIWNSFEPVVAPPSSDSRPQPPTPFEIKHTLPVLIYQPPVDYPAFARLQRLEGVVVVEVLVGTQGQVVSARIRTGAHPLLEQAALQAALGCRFTPGRQREVPVPVRVAVPYRFAL